MKRARLLTARVLMGSLAIAACRRTFAAGNQDLLVWSDKPLILMKNPPKPRKYFQRQWGSGVYPIGNGRLGSTLYGAMARERIQFNEDSLWSGDEGETGAYQSFGEMFVTFDGMAEPDANACQYRRQLDIGKGVHTISYCYEGVQYHREYFASHPANVMVFRFTADKKAGYSGTLTLKDRHGHKGGVMKAEGDTITFFGSIKPGKINLQYEAQAKLLHEGGSIAVDETSITFKDCDSLTILLDAGTDYLNQREKGWKQDPPHASIEQRLAAASNRSYEALLKEHLTDYRALFGRVSLDLGASSREKHELTTGKRLEAYRKAGADPDLEELLFAHARYLMISSSRPGDLPANLQGVWNPYNWPPWRSDYHSDVNVEMNYWFVDQANLPECFVPYASWLHSVIPVRRDATKKEFGVRGWMTRSENGIFGGATYHWVPGDSAWLAQNIWDHYAFTQDREYLASRAYPIMKELCETWEDYLKEGPDGKLVSPASISPEHGPKAEGNSYEQQLVYDLFTNYIEASKTLGVDEGFRKKVSSMRSRLLGPQIGKWGQLQEWAEDLDKPKDHHRHLSHMIAVHPGRQISPLTTPKLAEAAKVSMNARGDGATGWSKAWKIAIWARLHDGNRAYKLLNGFISGNVYPNLWGFHPPFQIDCNFGYAAGVNEMLVQSHLKLPEGERDADGGGARLIHLLPALPDAWPNGSVKGMCVRGGYELDMVWSGGALDRVVIRSAPAASEAAEILYKGKFVRVVLPDGQQQILSAADFE